MIYLIQEINKYFSVDTEYDPYAVAVALRLRVEKLAYQKLPKGLSVDNEMVNISQSGNTYFITTYLQVNYMIEG